VSERLRKKRSCTLRGAGSGGGTPPVVGNVVEAHEEQHHVREVPRTRWTKSSCCWGLTFLMDTYFKENDNFSANNQSKTGKKYEQNAVGVGFREEEEERGTR
jgi:hypothetical protein